MAIRGDTVRFKVLFKGYSGKVIKEKPSAVYFRFYNCNEEMLYEQVVSDKEGESYYHDFTITEEYDEGIYTYEFEGVFVDKPFVARDEIRITFS